MGILRMEDVSFAYDENAPVVKNINLSIKKGTVHCLVGRSGCGKTTLLKLAAGLLQPEVGKVLINGKVIDRPAEQSSIVFQSPTLLRWRTVKENVLLPFILRGKVGKKYEDQAINLLAQMNIKEQAEKYPYQLSGGQQSRVAIARALITNPDILFMDEPFAALDAFTREALQTDLRKIVEQENKTVLFITHDIEEAVFLADSISMMTSGTLERMIEKIDRNSAFDRHHKAFQWFCRLIRDGLEGKSV